MPDLGPLPMAGKTRVSKRAAEEDAGSADAGRFLSTQARGEDQQVSLRPLTLADFTGQEAARGNLKIFIDAAKGRREALDHVLLVGPPGLGKTTLAQIVARELGVNFLDFRPRDRQSRRPRGAVERA